MSQYALRNPHICPVFPLIYNFSSFKRTSCIIKTAVTNVLSCVIGRLCKCAPKGFSKIVLICLERAQFLKVFQSRDF